MKKILIISPYFPFPARDGGKVRLYNLIKHLSYNNEIYLLAYIEPNANKNCIELAKEFCTEVFPVLREEDKRIVKDDIPRCVISKSNISRYLPDYIFRYKNICTPFRIL